MSWRMLTTLAVAFALIVIGSVYVVHRWRQPSVTVTEPRRQATSVVEEQESLSPFQNTAANVKYVGDAVCARCHPKIAETYAAHPMGRSIATVAKASPIENYGSEGRTSFQAGGFKYVIERRGERVFHREELRDANGRLLSQAEAEVQYAVGSGMRGRSYLIDLDGYLFMSPITWYPQKRIWDLSPGYAVRNQHFGRPIMAECLFCHCQRAESVEGSLNRYHQPIFEGMTIGCERCHGPGELHVLIREQDVRPEGVDYTIVNPRHLDQPRREAVCEQCHLQGQHRILRAHRKVYDYRPGLPLHDFLSVFVKAPKFNENNKFVGQVEQMYASKCFQESNGRLGCISCHDPHYLPPPEQKVAFYRQRCLNCHEQHGCSMPLAARLELSREDDCAQCHMPINETSITHTAVSDHRVLKRPEEEKVTPPPELRVGEFPIVHFHRHLVPGDDPSIQRDLAIALMELAQDQPESVQPALGELALPLLEPWLAQSPEDVAALEAKANALWFGGRLEEAASLFDEVLRREPKREQAVSNAATLALEMHRWNSAQELFTRAITLNPKRWRYRLGLAQAMRTSTNGTRPVTSVSVL